MKRKKIHPIILAIIFMVLILAAAVVLPRALASHEAGIWERRSAVDTDEMQRRSQERIDAALEAGQSEIIVPDGETSVTARNLSVYVRNFADEYMGFGSKNWELAQYENGRWIAAPLRADFPREGIALTLELNTLRAEQAVAANFTLWHGELSPGRYKIIFEFIHAETATYRYESKYEFLFIEFEIA